MTTRRVLDQFDHASRDPTTSSDAMRWIPDPTQSPEPPMVPQIRIICIFDASPFIEQLHAVKAALITLTRRSTRP